MIRLDFFFLSLFVKIFNLIFGILFVLKYFGKFVFQRKKCEYSEINCVVDAFKFRGQEFFSLGQTLNTNFKYHLKRKSTWKEVLLSSVFYMFYRRWVNATRLMGLKEPNLIM